MYALKLVFGLLLLLAAPVQAESARIAVASNFRAAMQPLKSGFEAMTQHRITISAGASGQLFAQITHGAPFDVFLSADQERPSALVESGNAVASSQFTYATGRLYLLLKDSNPDSQGTPDLSGIRRISIANPRTAPYGAAAMQALEHLSASGQRPVIASAQTISGVNAAMAAGAVDAGFAALASVAPLQTDRPAGWLVPEDLHDPIRQDAVLLSRASDNAAAIAFLAWLKGDAARSILRSYGYHVD